MYAWGGFAICLFNAFLTKIFKFLPEKFGGLTYFSYLCSQQASLSWTGRLFDIDGMEPLAVRMAGLREGVYETLLFCVFKLRNFETLHRSNATRRRVGELYTLVHHVI